MHDGGNRIYGLHVITHNGLCLHNTKSLKIFEDFVVHGQYNDLWIGHRGQGLSSGTITLVSVWLLQWKTSASLDVPVLTTVPTSINVLPSCFAAVRNDLTTPPEASFNSGSLEPSLCQYYCLTTFQSKVSATII